MSKNPLQAVRHQELQKAITDIEKNFGKKPSQFDKPPASMRDVYNRLGKDGFWDYLKNKLPYNRRGDEYHLNKKELADFLAPMDVSVDDQAFRDYEEWAKAIMDAIHVRYTHKPKQDWPKLDKLYKPMAKYRQRYMIESHPGDLDMDSIKDYLANSVEDDDSPADSLAELGLDKAQAKKLVGAWFKVDPKKRLSISMNSKQFDSWLEDHFGVVEYCGPVSSLKKTITKLEGKSMGRVRQLKTLIEDQLPGGKGDKADPSQFDPKQIEMGLKVEMEHTDNKDVAMEIVLDHLTEDPEYYTKLKQVHQEALKKDDLKAVEDEVTSSFEPEEIKAFKSFDDFFDAVDVQNGYEEEWNPKKWKPYYKAVYDKLTQGNK